MRFGILFVLAVFCSPAFAQLSSAPSTCGVPLAINDGWVIDKPQNVGLNAERLCGIEVHLKGTNANSHALIIIRHGKLVFEQYCTGHDHPWDTPEGQFIFEATTKHDMRSVSKSVTSLLVGIAIDRKLITSVEEPVVKFFPEFASLRTPGWDAIKKAYIAVRPPKNVHYAAAGDTAAPVAPCSN